MIHVVRNAAAAAEDPCRCVSAVDDVLLFDTMHNPPCVSFSSSFSILSCVLLSHFAVGIVDFSQEVFLSSSNRHLLLTTSTGKMDLHDRLCHRSPWSVLFLVNCSLSSLPGFEPQELVGRPSLELVHPDELNRVRQLH